MNEILLTSPPNDSPSCMRSEQSKIKEKKVERAKNKKNKNNGNVHTNNEGCHFLDFNAFHAIMLTATAFI